MDAVNSSHGLNITYFSEISQGFRRIGMSSRRARLLIISSGVPAWDVKVAACLLGLRGLNLMPMKDRNASVRTRFVVGYVRGTQTKVGFRGYS